MLCTHLNSPAMRPGRPKRDSTLPVVALEHQHLVVRAVGDEDVALRRVLGQHEVPHRAVLQRLRLDAVLLHELAAPSRTPGCGRSRGRRRTRRPSFATAHAVHRVAELLRSRLRRVVGRQLVVVRRLAVGAPVALVGAGASRRTRRRAGWHSRRRRRARRAASIDHVRGPAEPRSVLFEPPVAPGLPICRRNLPSCVNFRICWSLGPLPASQTLPCRSTWMPCSLSGQS